MYTRMAAQTMTVVVIALLAAGCATGSKGPSDRDLIMSTMNEWKAGLVAKDADQTIAAYSEDFRDGEGRGKAELHAFIKEAADMGYLDSLIVNLDTVQVTINGEEATVSPVTLSSSAGSMTLYMALKKEEGAWRIVRSTGS